MSKLWRQNYMARLAPAVRRPEVYIADPPAPAQLPAQQTPGPAPPTPDSPPPKKAALVDERSRRAERLAGERRDPRLQGEPDGSSQEVPPHPHRALRHLYANGKAPAASVASHDRSAPDHPQNGVAATEGDHHPHPHQHQQQQHDSQVGNGTPKSGAWAQPNGVDSAHGPAEPPASSSVAAFGSKTANNSSAVVAGKPRGKPMPVVNPNRLAAGAHR